MTPSQAAQEKPTSPRTARMMMGELMMMAEHWRVDGLPSVIPPRVDQQKLQALLEEMIEQAQAEVTAPLHTCKMQVLGEPCPTCEAAAATPSLDALRLALIVYDAMPVHEINEQSIRVAEGRIILAARDYLARLDEGSATPDQGKGESR